MVQKLRQKVMYKTARASLRSKKDFKCEIVSKFNLGQLNAYKTDVCKIIINGKTNEQFFLQLGLTLCPP